MPTNSAGGDGGRRFYGTELDIGIRGRFDINNFWLQAGLQGGLLMPGAGLANSLGNTDGTVGAVWFRTEMRSSLVPSPRQQAVVLTGFSEGKFGRWALAEQAIDTPADWQRRFSERCIWLKSDDHASPALGAEFAATLWWMDELRPPEPHLESQTRFIRCLAAPRLLDVGGKK